MIDIFDIKAAVFKQINTAAAFISSNTILDHTSKENLMKNRSLTNAEKHCTCGGSVCDYNGNRDINPFSKHLTNLILPF